MGVLLERSPEMIEAFLAILKAGGAYVPLDPSWPEERRAELIDEAGVRVIPWDRGRPARTIQKNAGGTPAVPGVGLLAYAMFTSGSTGRPKTVGIEHRSIVRLVRGADWADLGRDQVFLQLASPAFDAATLEIWGALANGGRLALFPPGAPSVEDLGAALERHGITTLWLTAGLFHQVVESRIDILRGVRQLLAGGDVLSPEAVDRVVVELPGCRMINGYGPTENTTFTCCHEVRGPLSGRTVPIGRPIAGTTVYVLDAHLQPVPELVPGELLAGGEGLARGYLGRPDLTAERFVPSPPFEDEPPGARLYRTGDRVRWSPRGELEFLGRLDRQVKIRGFRVEPAEIEAVLARHPGVSQAAVIVVDDTADRRLVACVVPAGEDLSGLRDWLADRLPAYLIPSLVTLPDLPLTPNGKVDRAALRGRLPEVEPQSGYVAPRTPVEELLAGVWAEVLGVERIGIHDDFFELGGHSLLATRVVSRVRAALDAEVPLAALFETPTVAGLARLIEERRVRQSPLPLAPSPVRPPSARPERERGNESGLGGGAPLPLGVGGGGRAGEGSGEGGEAPLSFAQERLWFLDRLEPGSATYNLPVAVRLRGNLDISALERSLGEILRRHAALRTTFHESGDGPIQVVAPPEPFRLPVDDAPGSMEEEARCPFDLEAGPIFRAHLFRLAPGDHLLLVNLHHIASDGWSMGILVREVAALYGAFREGRPSPLPELPVQYADYARWQRSWLSGEALAAELAWWRETLAGLPERLDLPTDHPRRGGAETRSGARRPVRLGSELTRQIAGLSRREGATPFMVVLAAFQTVLGRWAGQEDLAVGSPIAGRTRMEVEDLIGFFVNTLVLRGDLRGDPTVRDLLVRTRRMVLATHEHQHLPFEKLVEELSPVRQLGRTPLFEAMLAFQTALPGAPELPGLEVEIVPVDPGVAKFDLLLDLTERGGELVGWLEHDADLFEAPTLDRLLGHFEALLSGMVSSSGERVFGLPLLSAAERHQILEWNASAVARPAEASIPALFLEQVDRTPEQEAVRFAGESLTYRDLEERSSRLARHLRRLGVGPEVVVGIALDRSLELIIALYATLKAGGAYLPLDLSHPDERLAFLLAEAGAPVVLTLAEHAPRFAGSRAAVVRLDAERSVIEAESTDRPPLEIRGDHLAYVIFTSGSTGAPKGAMNTHAAIANRLLWMQEAYRLDASDRVLQKTPSTFDVSVWEFFWPLIAGATLVIARPEGHRDSSYLLRTIHDEAITVLHFVPSMLQVFLDEPGVEEAASRLRQVMASGEALPADLASRFAERLPGVRLHNLYGPTEAAVDVTSWTVEAGEPAVSLGRPIANLEIHILDRSFRPVPVGVAGELCIGGAGLARGYLGRPDLTPERFVPALSGAPGARLYRTGDLACFRPDGRIEYLGRIDHQVKIRGLRIEPGEIEAAILGHSVVKEAVVVAREDRPGDRRLVAYLVPGQGELRIEDLRASLRARLPEHMVPSAFMVLEALPLTANGKLDRRALPAPEGRPRAASVPPRTEAEQAIAGAWREALGLEAVGVDESFFDLGGHSLLATRVLSRIREAFRVDLPLRALFEEPTVAGLARRIEAAVQGPHLPSLPIVPIPRVGALPLSFAQQRLWFLDQLEPGAPLYNIPAALRATGPLDVPALTHALGEVGRRHEALRTTFASVEGAPVQVVQPPSAFSLPVVDLSGLAEPEGPVLGLAAKEALRPFDLAQGPVWRALCLRLGPADHVLLVTMHHIASDGWSMGILVREVLTLYGAHLPLPELPVQYADYALWQRDRLQGDLLQNELAYWREQLASLPALELPTDRPRPAIRSHRGSNRPVELGADLTAGLRRLARREGTTLFMILLAAFEALLARHSGQRDLAVGSPIAGREHLEIEGLIGFFVNTLVLRGDLSGDPPFRTLLARARETVLAAHLHQEVPFERLVEELEPDRSPSRTPLFQVMLSLGNAPRDIPETRGLRLWRMDAAEILPPVARFDLSLALEEREGGLSGVWEHSAELFDATTIARMAGHLERLLAAVVADPGLRLSELPLLGEVERHQLALAWNDTTAPAPPDLLVHQLFEAQAERQPEAIALRQGSEVLTYGELAALSHRLAHHLRRLRVRPEEPVGVCLERVPLRIAALLAVLQAGGVYLPLDPAYPRARRELMLRDSGARVLLTSGWLATLGWPVPRVVPLDEIGAELAAESLQSAGRSRAARDPGVHPLHLGVDRHAEGNRGRPRRRRRSLHDDRSCLRARSRGSGAAVRGARLRCLPGADPPHAGSRGHADPAAQRAGQPRRAVLRASRERGHRRQCADGLLAAMGRRARRRESASRPAAVRDHRRRGHGARIGASLGRAPRQRAGSDVQWLRSDRGGRDRYDRPSRRRRSRRSGDGADRLAARSPHRLGARP